MSARALAPSGSSPLKISRAHTPVSPITPRKRRRVGHGNGDTVAQLPRLPVAVTISQKFPHTQQRDFRILEDLERYVTTLNDLEAGAQTRAGGSWNDSSVSFQCPDAAGTKCTSTPDLQFDEPVVARPNLEPNLAVSQAADPVTIPLPVQRFVSGFENL
ncbi:MAG: hypothetical protein M1813_002190 [Trichoglossum hirsutum]|nr:MAG: hypothetical protein M1813_002190 [Trichoglossum hirsutum]